MGADQSGGFQESRAVLSSSCASTPSSLMAWRATSGGWTERILCVRVGPAGTAALGRGAA